jgi:hypothetical protein
MMRIKFCFYCGEELQIKNGYSPQRYSEKTGAKLAKHRVQWRWCEVEDHTDKTYDGWEEGQDESDLLVYDWGYGLYP